LTGDPDGEVEFRARAGIAGPLVDLRIVDTDMNNVPHDGKSAGEIVLRAPWLTQGYFNNPKVRNNSGPAVTCTPAILPWSMPPARCTSPTVSRT